MAQEKKQHYVDNKLFFAEMQKWKEEMEKTLYSLNEEKYAELLTIVE